MTGRIQNSFFQPGKSAYVKILRIEVSHPGPHAHQNPEKFGQTSEFSLCKKDPEGEGDKQYKGDAYVKKSFVTPV